MSLTAFTDFRAQRFPLLELCPHLGQIDIVYVDLPKVGTKLEQGKSLGSVESVKAVSDIYSPVSGEVIEINESLTAAPEKLNEDPHGAAWLVKLRMSAPDEVKQLLSSSDYQTYIKAEN